MFKLQITSIELPNKVSADSLSDDEPNIWSKTSSRTGEFCQLCFSNTDILLENTHEVRRSIQYNIGDKKSYIREGESENHKILKSYVCNNPDFIGLSADFVSRRTEKSLDSGDEVDVYFEYSKSLFAIEIKSRRSNASDVVRGIFQCVKYRAVLRAQESVSMKLRQVGAWLVYEGRLTKTHKSIAKRLGVKIICVSNGPPFNIISIFPSNSVNE